jgi:putative oxidoreductase
MQNITHPTFLLRCAVVVILAMHGVTSFLNGSIHAFGTLYLDKVGFAPFGLVVAWLVKLTHVVAIPLLLLNKYVKPVCLANIFIFVMGIFMIHIKDGWYVVGGGRNGVEFNFLLIFAMLTIMFPKGLGKQ